MPEKKSPKLNRQISYRIFTSIIAVITLTVAAIAWFASNDNVKGQGMDMQSDVSGDVLIAKDATTLKNMTIEDATYTVSFDLVSSDVVPVRRDPTCATTSSTAYPTTTTYLQYDANPGAVDAKTGVKPDTDFAAVPIDSTEYYTDYEVYIAAAQVKMPISKLTIKLEWTPLNDTERAFSVDVYRTSNAGKSWKFYRTLNLNNKGKNVSVLSNSTIPLNTGGSYIKLLLRCYFDGGLVKDKTTGATYINSATLSPTEVNAKFTFTATDK